MQDFWKKELHHPSVIVGVHFWFSKEAYSADLKEKLPRANLLPAFLHFWEARSYLRIPKPEISTREIATGTVMKSLRASASPGTLAGPLRQQAWLRACLM